MPSHDVAAAGPGEAALLSCVAGVAVQPAIAIIVTDIRAVRYDALMFLVSLISGLNCVSMDRSRHVFAGADTAVIRRAPFLRPRR